MVGTDIYEKLIKGYTEKQWGRPCRELPSFIIRRLPVRYTYDNNYFTSHYQGIPIGVYTRMVEKMRSGIEVRLNVDYLEDKAHWDSLADRVVYTGPIDAYFGYCCGPLAYRSVRFETEVLDMPNFQGNAVVNYTDRETPFTRIIEHKHFEFGTQSKTVISREYSPEWEPGMEPYYPVNDEPGMNHKGLVTFDRKTKKDSFYLYKAWWSSDPFVHICSKRFVDRTGDTITVKVYSNQPTVTLRVNGREIGSATEEDHVFTFRVKLEGETKITAFAGKRKDTAVFRRVDTPNPDYVLKKSKNQQASNWVDA